MDEYKAFSNVQSLLLRIGQTRTGMWFVAVYNSNQQLIYRDKLVTRAAAKNAINQFLYQRILHNDIFPDEEQAIII